MKENTFAKSIKLFLIDGNPSGRMSCELSNWTGKAYRLPRTTVKISGDRSDLSGVGVYLLFGKDVDDSTKDMVYIGETENILERLKQHMDKKEFWNEAIVITSKDDNLNKAHIRYLEYKLYQLAKEVSRFRIENQKIPSCPAISEADEAEMNEFLHNVKLLVNTLGYKVFEELVKRESDHTTTFKIQASRGANAKGFPTNEGFVVLEGSTMAYDTVNSTPKGTIDLRNRLLEDKVVIEKDGQYVFTHNFLFSSPSTAASVIMGRSANGQTEWRLSDTLNLKNYENPNP